MRENPTKFTEDLAHVTAISATNQIVQKMPEVLAFLKRQKGDQAITSEDVASAFALQNPVYGQIIRGGWNSPPEVTKRVEQLLAANGVQTVEAGAKTAEQLRAGTTETRILAGREAALRSGKAETAAAITEAELPARKDLVQYTEDLKRRMEAGAFPDKKEQATLRDRYRTTARLIVEAQYKGPLGQINLTTDQERADFEKKIEAKGVELANSDGLGFVFPGKKATPAAPKGESLSKKDPRYTQARNVLKLTDAEIEKRYDVKITE